MARRPRPEVAVGWPSRAAQFAYAAAPQLTERAISAVMRAALDRAKPAARTEGALLSPTAAGVTASGGWLRRWKTPSAGVLSRGLMFGALGLALAGAVTLRRRRRIS
jgi:hypothetical protein